MRHYESIRRDFVANVSHEIKTPVTTIKGFAETLLDGALDDRHDAERFSRIIVGQADRLSAIIEDLLSLSSLESGSEGATVSLERGGSTGGALAGLTFVVKENIDVEGHVSRNGEPAFAASHAPAGLNAPAVDRLLAAGARLVGKAHMDEMAYSLLGANHHYGTPVNPAAPDRHPGGSSSGSAVAVAAGLADFALGTDTAGSCRAPASP